MTARRLVTGAIVRMTRAIAKNGANYLVLSVAERQRQWTVTVFDERLAAAIEAGLRPGVDVAVSGRLFSRRGRDAILVADAGLSALGPLRGKGKGWVTEAPPEEPLQGAPDELLLL